MLNDSQRHPESRQMRRNPKDPPKETRFKKGQSGNPGGKTSDQRKAEVEAAEKAALIRDNLLNAILQDMQINPETEKMIGHLRNETLKLVTDTLDRAHGKPVQKVDNTSSDGTMTPRDQSEATLDALKRKHADPE